MNNDRGEALAQVLRDVLDAAKERAQVERAIRTAVVGTCRAIGCQVGHAFVSVTESALAAPGHYWHCDAPDRFDAFRRATESVAWSNIQLRLFEARQPFAIDDLTKEPGFLRAQVATECGIRWGVFCPILVDGGLVGALEFFHAGSISSDERLFDLLGEICTVLGWAIERAKANPELSANDVSHRLIFGSINIGMVMVSTEGRLLRANGAFARFLGYSEGELAGRVVIELTHPDDREATRSQFAALVSGRAGVVDIEKRYLRRDGTAVWARTGAVLVPGNAGHYVLGFIQDADGRKHAERLLSRLSGQLLRLQDEERRRMAHLVHETAAQTAAALAANLQVIQREQPLAPRASKALADSIELADDCSRELRTLAHLLQGAQLDQGSLASTLRWYVDGFAARSGLDAELHISPSAGRLKDEVETAIFRLVQESLINVQRHSRSPTVSIRIELRGMEVAVEVADRGQGIAPAVLERLRATGPASVGVGIAGMQERVRQLGGRLELESGPAGTMVRAVLPAVGTDS